MEQKCVQLLNSQTYTDKSRYNFAIVISSCMRGNLITQNVCYKFTCTHINAKEIIMLDIFVFTIKVEH